MHRKITYRYYSNVRVFRKFNYYFSENSSKTETSTHFDENTILTGKNYVDVPKHHNIIPAIENNDRLVFNGLTT